MSDATGILRIILAKLDETNEKMSTLERHVRKLGYETEKTERRLEAVIQLYEAERMRCETLEATNRTNAEQVSQLRTKLVKTRDRLDILLWLQNGTGEVGGHKIEEVEIKAEEDDVDAVIRGEEIVEERDNWSGSIQTETEEEIGEAEEVRKLLLEVEEMVETDT